MLFVMTKTGWSVPDWHWKGSRRFHRLPVSTSTMQMLHVQIMFQQRLCAQIAEAFGFKVFVNGENRF